MLSFECFKGLPLEYESFLLDKYDSFITTCGYIEVNYTSYDVNYMMVYEDSILIEILIFGNKGKTSTCFNSLVEIDQHIVSEFSKKIFEKYGHIQRIEIIASYNNYCIEKAFLFYKSDDQILNLPTSLEDYYLELGYHTRKNIKNRRVRLFRDYPNVKFYIKYGDEIKEDIIEKIIQLNQERMKHKGVIPLKDTASENNIYKYSQYYGCVAYIEIEGQIVAGCIATILNKDVYAHVISHDNNFSKYNVGELCMFYVVQTSIEKGMSTFHFLWGEAEYKKRLLAIPHLLFSYFIYRTYSLDYVIVKVKVVMSNALLTIKHSKVTKPLREVVKSYRRKKYES